MKKQRPDELVTLAELARRAGVAPCSVSQFLRKQESKGAPVPTVPGSHRRERLVDLNHPLVRGYLENRTAQPSNRSGGIPPGPATTAKLRAQVEKTELAAAALRAGHVDRDFTLRYLNRLQEVERRELAAMVDRILAGLVKEFGPVSAKQAADIRRILERPCQDALDMTDTEIKKFRRETEPRTRFGEPSKARVKPEARRGKNYPLPRR